MKTIQSTLTEMLSDGGYETIGLTAIGYANFTPLKPRGNQLIGSLIVSKNAAQGRRSNLHTEQRE